MRQLLLLAFAGSAAGHGYITEPPSRTGATLEVGGSCAYGACYWFNQGCTIGCKKCKGVAGDPSGKCGFPYQKKATLPQAMRTYNVGNPACGINPWCAPGSAPVMSPCGVAGGDVRQGLPGNGGDEPPGYKFGFRGEELPPLRSGGLRRTWKAGGVVDVAWATVANHGGGYQYRLCPKAEAGGVSEECFQRTPLDFVGDESYIQYCKYPYPSDRPFPHDHKSGVTPGNTPPEQAFPGPCDPDRQAFPARRVSTGTLPKGSTWTANPIPACNNALGGSYNYGCGKKSGGAASSYQFKPPGADRLRPGFLLGGFGSGSCYGCNAPDMPADCDAAGSVRKNCTDGSRGHVDQQRERLFQWSVVDKVRVPDVPPGEYLVSFRWDSEQTPQIWASCSDVTIVGGDGPAPPPAPTPPAELYGCFAGQCAPDAGGVPQQTCLAVCH